MKSMPSNGTLARFKCNEPRARARSRSAAATVKNAVTLPSNAGQVKYVQEKQMCGHCTTVAMNYLLHSTCLALDLKLKVTMTVGIQHRVLTRRSRVVVVSPPAESAPALLRLVAFGT